MCELVLEGKESPEPGAQGGRDRTEEVVEREGHAIDSLGLRVSSMGIRDIEKGSKRTSFALGEIKKKKKKNL